MSLKALLTHNLNYLHLFTIYTIQHYKSSDQHKHLHSRTRSISGETGRSNRLKGQGSDRPNTCWHQPLQAKSQYHLTVKEKSWLRLRHERRQKKDMKGEIWNKRRHIKNLSMHNHPRLADMSHRKSRQKILRIKIKYKTYLKPY